MPAHAARPARCSRSARFGGRANNSPPSHDAREGTGSERSEVGAQEEKKPVQAGLETLVLTVDLINDLSRSVRKASVPLVLGLISGAIAGVLYLVFLPAEPRVQDYFSAAAQVGVGVLLALVVELRAERSFAEASYLERQGRVGIVILTAVGCAGSLAGTLVSGSAPASGLLFGLSWGGTTAGVAGLFQLLLNRRRQTEDTDPSSNSLREHDVEG
jgi:hypothetical protein